MLRDRRDELIFIEADGKDDLLETGRAGNLSDYFLRDVRFELLIWPEAVNEDAHCFKEH
jgi:hypothetical protein